MYVYNCIITLRESSHHEERHEYQESIKDYWDYYSTMTTSFNKGKAEGEDEAKRESALRMKGKGYTLVLTMCLTLLSMKRGHERASLRIHVQNAF